MKYKKILIIKLGAFGDLVMLTPAIKLIRTNFPDSEITLLVSDKYKEIIENNPYIDNLISVKCFENKNRNYFDILKTLKLIREQKFDLLINFHTSLKMNLFAFLSGVKERIGFDINGGFLNTKVIKYFKLKGKHESVKYIELLKAIGINPKIKKIEYKIHVPYKLEKCLDKKLKSKKIKKNMKLIGFVIGGSENSKFHLNRRWPIQNWISLANKIQEKDKKIKILLIGDKKDWEIGEKIKNETMNTINLCGFLDIKELVILMKRLRYLISVDTGPMHIGASQTKVIALFGPTDPKEFGPLPFGRHIIIKSNRRCSPCYIDGKYKKCFKNECMMDITPNHVFSFIKL